MRDRREQRFLTLLGLLIVVVVFAGFAPTYYLRSGARPPLSLLLHLHGALFTAWIVLFVVQVRLVAARNIRLHRRLGAAGVALAAVMVVVVLTAIIVAARRDVRAGGGTGPLSFMAVALGDAVIFGTLAGAGFAFRRNAAAHKRLMCLGTIALLPAAFARWPAISGLGPLGFFVATDVVVAICIVADVILRKRVHPVLVSGAAFIVLSQPARLLLGKTETWQTFARWLIA